MNKVEPDDKRKLMIKLMTARTSLLRNVPFYGTLLMRMKLCLAPCGTACTDMKRIFWDPEFLDRLSHEEVKFVLLHEIWHCVLEHVDRSKGKLPEFYNVACDIVVNSLILELYGIKEFKVDGVEAMHLAPDGVEGREYSAEQVYFMLLQTYTDNTGVRLRSLEDFMNLWDMRLDNHEIWVKAPVSPEDIDQWRNLVKETAKKGFSLNELPPRIRELLESEDYRPVINWRYMLREFLQLVSSSYEYSFLPPDHRFPDSSFILPAFQEPDVEMAENIWFLIDTSGSIDAELLTAVFSELRASIEQSVVRKAKVSCFDTSVTDPIEVGTVEELAQIMPLGGGGTSFECIFEYLEKELMEEPPAAILIMTDGLSCYPEPEAARGIPVLWILNDYEDDAPWGKSIHVDL